MKPPVAVEVVMMSVTMFALLACCPQDPSKPAPEKKAEAVDTARIQALIRDLGGDAKQREEAKRELRKIGAAAVPDLKQAAADGDAERAMAARSLLLQILRTEDKPTSAAADVRVIYRDWSRGIDFLRDESGRITLTVPEQAGEGGKREFKTYRAESLEEFKKRYPDVAKTYEVDKLATPEALSAEAQRAWSRLKEELDLDGRGGFLGLPDDARDLDLWIERQERELQRRLRAHDGDDAESRKPSFGLLVGPLSPSLRAQLNLPEGKGLLVFDVSAGSLAEASGIKKFDVLSQLEGRPVQGAESFRTAVEKAMESREFTLEVIRAGQKQALMVRPPQAKRGK